jgi:hypothetical protein
MHNQTITDTNAWEKLWCASGALELFTDFSRILLRVT